MDKTNREWSAVVPLEGLQIDVDESQTAWQVGLCGLRVPAPVTRVQDEKLAEDFPGLGMHCKIEENTIVAAHTHLVYMAACSVCLSAR